MNLREKIELCLRAEADPAKAAILVMGMLEMRGPELSGNGWVDDDPVLLGDDGHFGPFNAACDQAAELLRAANGDALRVSSSAQGGSHDAG